MVKNLFLTKGTLAAMLLASPLMAQATSDEYPAADFQPKVLYSDSNYKHSESTTSSSSRASKTEADPNFPAATFEPKVVYQDPSYKHRADNVKSVSSRSTGSASSSAASSSTSASAGETKEESSDQTMLIAVVALAVIGFFFYRQKAGTPSAPSAAPRARASRPAPRANVEAAEGATRVEKYLAKKQPKETRVSKYLASKQQSLPTTGVAKYLAKQVVRSRKLAEENATGVEKYLRKKKG